MRILKKVLIIELLILIYDIGWVLGINKGKKDNQNKLNKTYIEKKKKKEKSYQLELENQKLNTILNNYAIEERKKSEQSARKMFKL